MKIISTNIRDTMETSTSTDSHCNARNNSVSGQMEASVCVGISNIFVITAAQWSGMSS